MTLAPKMTSHAELIFNLFNDLLNNSRQLNPGKARVHKDGTILDPISNPTYWMAAGKAGLDHLDAQNLLDLLYKQKSIITTLAEGVAHKAKEDERKAVDKRLGHLRVTAGDLAHELEDARIEVGNLQSQLVDAHYETEKLHEKWCTLDRAYCELRTQHDRLCNQIEDLKDLNTHGAAQLASEVTVRKYYENQVTDLSRTINNYIDDLHLMRKHHSAQLARMRKFIRWHVIAKGVIGVASIVAAFAHLF